MSEDKQSDNAPKDVEASAAEVDPQLADLQRELQAAQDENAQLNAELETTQPTASIPIVDTKVVHGFGKYIIPVDNSLDSHHSLVFDRDNKLDFWPEQSPAFDSLVAQTFLAPAFSYSNHPDYFDYEPLRDNVATVRNYVLAQVLEGVDVEDPAQMQAANRTVEQMGREIGVALQRDSLFRRPGSAHLDVDVASEPGVGAAKIYELLVKKQEKNKFMHSAKALFGFDYSSWNLPPVEASPFSQAHVEAFCIKEGKKGATAPLAPDKQPQPATETAPAMEPQPQEQAQPADTPSTPAAEQPEKAKAMSQAQQLSVLGATIAGSVYSLDRVNKLPKPVKDRSVELAREILDKLRMGISDTDRDQWLSQSTESALAQGEAVASLAELYADSYHAALLESPQLEHDPTILAGNEALGKLAFLTKQQAAYGLLEAGEEGDAQTLLSELQSYPESWKQVENASIADLLNQMQAGLELTHGTLQQARAKNKDCAEMVANGEAQMSSQQLQQLLQNNGVSPQDLESVRQLQAQAASMPEEPRQAALRHAETVNQAATPESTAQQGNYRTAMQNQSREQEFLKR